MIVKQERRKCSPPDYQKHSETQFIPNLSCYLMALGVIKILIVWKDNFQDRTQNDQLRWHLKLSPSPVFEDHSLHQTQTFDVRYSCDYSVAYALLQLLMFRVTRFLALLSVQTTLYTWNPHFQKFSFIDLRCSKSSASLFLQEVVPSFKGTVCMMSDVRRPTS